MTIPITTGAAIANAGLPLSTDSRIAKQVNARSGGIALAQLALTITHAVCDGISCPVSPTSGWCPTRRTEPTIVLVARTTSTDSAKPTAAMVLAQNTWVRLTERVNRVFQVPI